MLQQKNVGAVPAVGIIFDNTVLPVKTKRSPSTYKTKRKKLYTPLHTALSLDRRTCMRVPIQIGEPYTKMRLMYHSFPERQSLSGVATQEGSRGAIKMFRLPLLNVCMFSPSGGARPSGKFNHIGTMCLL